MHLMELSDRDEPWITHRLQILILVSSMNDWRIFDFLEARAKRMWHIQNYEKSQLSPSC